MVMKKGESVDPALARLRLLRSVLAPGDGNSGGDRCNNRRSGFLRNVRSPAGTQDISCGYLSRQIDAFAFQHPHECARQSGKRAYRGQHSYRHLRLFPKSILTGSPKLASRATWKNPLVDSK
jgi:hypothetical protein